MALVRSSGTVGAWLTASTFKQAAAEAGNVGIAAATSCWGTREMPAAAGVYYATRQNVDGYGHHID
jgi:hypothetical protein